MSNQISQPGEYNLLRKMALLIAPGVYVLVGFFSNILILLGQLLASVYEYIWPYSGRSWFDHRFDFLRGPKNIFWLERAFFANNLLNDNDVVLDIGCGDGIFSGLFYSIKAKWVDAIDLDKDAIVHAKSLYPTKNIKFSQKNILTWKPAKKYDKIFMFAVIEHFTPKDGLDTLSKIGKSLNKGGVLLGSTPIFKEQGGHNLEHYNEFVSIPSLKKFLSKKFKKVKIFVSDWPGRLECYFKCGEPI